jgi:membrane-associated phospholipid phosphatase
MATRRLIPLEHPRLRGYNPLDWLAMIYFAITGVILAIGHDRVPHGGGFLLLHVGIVGGIALLGFVPRRGNVLLMFLRDTYVVWALPLLYMEVGVLDRVVWPGFFDATVLGWEKSLFGLFPSLYLHEWFPNRILSEFFHFSYLSYYMLVPILGFWLYLRGRYAVGRVMFTTVMLTFFTSYLFFIFFPVAGPYYAFLREPVTGRPEIFAPIVHHFIENGASRGTAFPSSHVAGALTVLWMTARFERPLLPLMITLFTGILVGVVYCGLHYGVDAIAGVMLGAACSMLGPHVHSWMLRRARLGSLRVRFPHLIGPLIASLWRFRRTDRGVSRRHSAI